MSISIRLSACVCVLNSYMCDNRKPSIVWNIFFCHLHVLKLDAVAILAGKSSYLSCRVRNIGNKSVSWIRHRDIHILTVGSYTYTSDQRFQATHHKETDDWTLQIKWAQKRDGGGEWD